MSPAIKGKKGTFSRLRLPVARGYSFPASRNPLLWVGALLVSVVMSFILYDIGLRGGGALSNGPLSSSHAVLESDCGSCHSEGKTMAASCSGCHEKFGDELGVYTLAAHYVYRSQDLQRVHIEDAEPDCMDCHVEHEGREAPLTRVAELECVGCHEFASFNSGHPQFEPLANGQPERGGLAFAHIQHIREVMKIEELTDVEQSCLYCHRPRPDGTSFEPLDFEAHCDSCHLTTAGATPFLPVAAAGVTGVSTLSTIQLEGRPGTEWALFTNPNEFRQRGPRVMKTPLHHEDPWVMENLRRLRGLLYEDLGLTDLLRTTPDVAPHQIRVLYEEAIAALEAQALGLRSRPEPEVQQDLERITELLAALSRKLEDPYADLDETRFLLDLQRRAGLADETVTATEEVIDALTEACRKCHSIEKAGIRRVETDQRVLRRAHFDHRAHILQVRCLECHNQIPIGDLAGGQEAIDKSVDNSAILNLAGIETCQQCHNPKLTSDRCVTCHYFHPNKSQRSNLLLYVDTE